MHMSMYPDALHDEKENTDEILEIYDFVLSLSVDSVGNINQNHF